MFLPPKRGKDQSLRRFLEFDITSRESEEVEEKFRQFLARDRMSPFMQTVREASRLYDQRVTDGNVMKGLTNAWNELSANDQLLAYVVATLAEKQGFQPTPAQIRQFLDSKESLVKTVSESANVKPMSPKPISFTLQIQGHQPIRRLVKPNQWNRLLLGVCELMQERNDSTFSKNVLDMDMRKWFSKSSKDFGWYQQIGDTGIYLKKGGKEIRQVCHSIVAKFGYPENALSIEVS